MSDNPFALLKRSSAKSFNDQKALIKKVMAGRQVNCPHCQQLIQLVLPEESETPGLYCHKGCTNIALDFVM